VESGDGSVDYWVITNEPGVFAVGRSARAVQVEEPVDGTIGATSRRGATGVCGVLGMHIWLFSFLVLTIARVRRRGCAPGSL